MTNSEQAIREFAEKWCLRVIECMKDDDYIMHDPEGILSDLTALISEHYYPKEFIDWATKNCRCESDGLWLYDWDEKSEQYKKCATTDELFNYWKENVR